MRRHLTALAAVLLLAVAGCGETRPTTGSANDCSACHGFPPATLTSDGSDHPQAPVGETWVAADCSPCHVTTVDASGAIIPGGTHADGKVDGRHAVPYPAAQHGPAAIAYLSSCRSCHGADLLGGTSGVSCNSCHDGWQTNCTFCHDPLVDAPTLHTRISATAVTPPECDACHGAGYSASARTVSDATHMDGTVQIPGVTCTSCHGTGTATAAAPRGAAPPVDVLGGTTVSVVGAHDTHLDGQSWSDGVACSDCHPGVAGYVMTHADGTTQVAFTGGGTYAGGTCSTTYCHGAFPGGNGADPTWTGTATCTSCHARPPSTGDHLVHVNTYQYGCESCHVGYTTTRTAGVITNVSVGAAAKPLHVNGIKNVTLVVGTWDGVGCTATCHSGTRTW